MSENSQLIAVGDAKKDGKETVLQLIRDATKDHPVIATVLSVAVGLASAFAIAQATIDDHERRIVKIEERQEKYSQDMTQVKIHMAVTERHLKEISKAVGVKE
jgi:hypothetical protein